MRELDKVLDQNEKVLWEGAPSFWPFLFGGSAVTTIFGLFWMVFVIAVMGIIVVGSGSLVFGFGIFLLPHFWVGIGLIFGIPIYQILVFKHTYYAITDKRVIVQTGLIGRDFKLIDFDQVTKLEVNVGFFDQVFGGNTGSILVVTAGSTHTGKGTPKPYVLKHITSPYDVFKLFKKVTHDVKTDIQYPNKLRPTENPGYQTDYDPNKK